MADIDIALLRRLARYIFTTPYYEMEERLKATSDGSPEVSGRLVWAHLNSLHDALLGLSDEMILSLSQRLLDNKPEQLGDADVEMP